MKPCDSIQHKLVADEALGAEETTHMAGCQDCIAFAGTLGRVATGLMDARQAAPESAEVADLRARVEERMRGRQGWARLAWAGSAMAAGILAVVLVLTGLPGTQTIDQTEERFLSLLDEISEITSLQDEEAVADAGEDAVYLTAALYEEEQIGTELDAELPGAYELLDEALDNSWL